MRLHHSLRLYANGDTTLNTVQEDHLAEHITYNSTMRPGTSLFVDGKLVRSGYPTSDQEEGILSRWDTFKFSDKPTVPYR